MDEQQFWQTIGAAFPKGGDPEDGLARLRGTLESWSRDDVVAFQRAFNKVMARAYTWDLIGAAHFAGVGQSDDGFEDFRARMVSLGREAFELLVRDANALAQVPFDESPTEEWGFEGLHMLPGEVGGEEGDENWPYPDDVTPTGEPLEDVDVAFLRERFPVLWERFGNRYMIGVDGAGEDGDGKWDRKDFAMSLVMFVAGALMITYGVLVCRNGYAMPLYLGSMLIGGLLALIGGNGVVQSVTAPWRGKTDW